MFAKKILQHDWLVFETVGDKNLLNKNLLRVVENSFKKKGE